MDPDEALARLRSRLDPCPPGLQTGLGDMDELAVWVRRDMLHLDADALNDRLHHWTQDELRERVPDASAHVSFHYAHPSNPHEDAELDVQERWLDLRPILQLELTDATTTEAVDAFAALVSRFLELVEGTGRPEGYRHHETGAVE